MAELIFTLDFHLAAVFGLAMNRAGLRAWAIAAALFTLSAQMGLVHGHLHWPHFPLWSLLGWLVAGLLFAASVPEIKRKYITLPAYRALKGAMPDDLRDRARGARGRHRRLGRRAVLRQAELVEAPPRRPHHAHRRGARLSRRADRPSSAAGSTTGASAMSCTTCPTTSGSFVCDNGFLGMLISKEHGGLGFSAQAQSLVLGKISSRSPDGVTIVMVPNSLGPGELIEKYGTDAQKEHFLPRLAARRGDSLLCADRPVLGLRRRLDARCRRRHARACTRAGRSLGIRLTWDKRYITLAPKATLLGLAFRLFDPDNHLGRGEDVGITLALIPTDHPGVEIGRRHLPGGAGLPERPDARARRVHPDRLDHRRQGAGRAGLAHADGAASPPAAPSRFPPPAPPPPRRCCATSTAYARIRKQFNLPIGFMEGVEEPLARMVEMRLRARSRARASRPPWCRPARSPR